MEINRVLEIDMLTGRDPEVLVRVMVSTPYREGIIPHENDEKANIIMLTNALMGIILIAEEKGIYKKGEAMKKVVGWLEDGYIDINTKASNVTFDDQGNLIKNPDVDPGS